MRRRRIGVLAVAVSIIAALVSAAPALVPKFVTTAPLWSRLRNGSLILRHLPSRARQQAAMSLRAWNALRDIKSNENPFPTEG